MTQGLVHFSYRGEALHKKRKQRGSGRGVYELCNRDTELACKGVGSRDLTNSPSGRQSYTNCLRRG
jgi:hypothetical protein